MAIGDFVVFGGEQAYAPPFLQSDTRMLGLVLKADHGVLQGVIDTLLNDPTGGAVDYRVIGEHVLLGHAAIASTRSTHPADLDKGFTPETDVAFWIPVAAYEDDQPKRVVWFMPYVWVDVPPTVITGRELYGFRKEMCWVEYEGVAFRADTMVLPTHTESTQLTRKPILDARLTGPEQVGNMVEDLGSLIDLVDDFIDIDQDGAPDVVDAIKIAGLFMKMALDKEIPMVFLKQFRDCVDPQLACHQEILESPATLQAAPRFRLMPKHQVTIYDYASHPIASDLGLGQPTNGSLTLTSVAAFEVHMTFLVELSKRIWRL